MALPKDIKNILKHGTKSSIPQDLSPMLATLVDDVFDAPGWLYEVKWDGYRALAYCNKSKVELRSRNNKIFDEKFYPVHAALKALKLEAVLDGEIIVMNDAGLSDFGALQNWRSEADGQLVFYIFDVLWYKGVDMTGVALSERRELLKAICPSDHPMIRLSDNFDTSATEFFAAAEKMGLEGIIAKKADSLYIPNNRSKDWLKIKTLKYQDVVIGGYTVNDDSPKLFSSLLLGVYDKGALQYIGKVGTGFSDKSQKEIMAKLKAQASKTCPFLEVPDVNEPSRFRPNPPHAKAFWLKPVVVGEVSYREYTSDRILRHPSFKGLREDKTAKSVTWEMPEHTDKIVKDKTDKATKAVIRKPGEKERKTLLNPTDETQVREVGGHELKFTNLSKIYWPKSKITKRDLINYYYQVAPIILPYMKDRPQSMNRFPNGIDGESFYQKDVKGKVPDWMATFPYHSEKDGRDKEFLVCNDEATLLYMAGLGCIEFNLWHSTVQKPDNPTWCVIDLDPGDKTKFSQVIEAAQVTKAVIDVLGLPSYCKTSGSTGLHIYIPFGKTYTYEQSKEFARALVTLVHHEIPKFTSIERIVKNRAGKMYLDFLQNRPQATIAGPYSLRPKPGATVSMPLEWDEVKPGLSIQDFNIHNAIDRIKDKGDLFKPVLGKGIDLAKAFNKLNGLRQVQ